MNILPIKKHNFFDGLFDEMLPLFHKSGMDTEFFSPSVDVEAQDDHYVITADIPGVQKDDISLSLANGILTLEARKEENKDEHQKGRLIRQERRSGSFARSFSVGTHVTEKDITAAFKDGVLTVTLPRLQQPDAENRRIKIK